MSFFLFIAWAVFLVGAIAAVPIVHIMGQRKRAQDRANDIGSDEMSLTEKPQEFDDLDAQAADDGGFAADEMAASNPGAGDDFAAFEDDFK